MDLLWIIAIIQLKYATGVSVDGDLNDQVTLLRHSLETIKREQVGQARELEHLRDKLEEKTNESVGNSKLLSQVSSGLRELHDSNAKLLEVEWRYRSKRAVQVDVAQLASTVDYLRQELIQINTLENQSGKNGDISRRIDNLASITEDITLQLKQLKRQSSSSRDQVTAISYIPGDMENIKKRVTEAEEKLSELDEINQWLEYSTKRQQADFDTTKQTIDSEIKKLTESVQFILNIPMVESGEEPFASGESSGESEVQHLHVTPMQWTNQLVGQMNDLEIKLINESARRKEIELTLKKVQSDEKSLRKRLEKMNMNMISKKEMQLILDKIDLLENRNERFEDDIVRDQLEDARLITNVQRIADNIQHNVMLSASAQKTAKVVRKVQMDHFSQLQNFSFQMNQMQTDILMFGLKLTNLQADYLNSTLKLHKTSVKDHQQDIQAVKLEQKMDQMLDFIPKTRANIAELQDQLISKVEYERWKEMTYFLDIISSKVGTQAKQLNKMYSIQQEQIYSLMAIEDQLPTDCSMNLSYAYARYTTGPYLIKPMLSNRSITVLCDMTDSGGGWTVIQSRKIGELSFNQSYDQYSHGFGSVNGDFWVGNNIIHLLTNRSGLEYSLIFEGWDIFDTYWKAQFNRFSISGPENNYKLHLSEPNSNSTLSIDSILIHNGMEFSTWDRDQDVSHTKCALYYGSGWWYQHCHKANLNGNFKVGMIWFQNSTGHWLQFKSTRMKIRPASFTILHHFDASTTLI